MSKILWHTIQIKVPSEMIELTKTGKVSVKKTLTKTFNISRSQKKPAIKLIPSNDNKVEIVNNGKEWDIDELKSRMTKAKQLEKKNATKNIFEPKEKKMINLNKFEGNIIKRAKELGQAKQAKKAKTNEIGESLKERKKRINKLNLQTKKGREEYKQFQDDTEELHYLNGLYSSMVEKMQRYGYLSYDDALQIVDISEKIYNLDNIQTPLNIKGNNWPKLLKSGSRIYTVVKKNY